MIKKAFISTIPVMTGYIVLGIGFGVLLKTSGYGFFWAFAMSLFIYAGSMEFVLINLLTGGASLLTVALTTLMVNARHLFYGISMVDRYKKIKKGKFYDIFALTDETYSLVCNLPDNIPEKDYGKYIFEVSILDQAYWLTGSILGSLLGSIIPFNTEGIDFALTALFITVFVEQWQSTKNHFPAIIGVVASIVSLCIFGTDNFLIPAMIFIVIALLTGKRFATKKEAQND